MFSNERYIVFIDNKEMKTRPRVGEVVTARVTYVRPDGRLNASLREVKEKALLTDSQRILELLASRNGKMPYSDESSPEVIRDKFQISKAAFKRGDKTFQWPAYNSRPTVTVTIEIPKDIWENYINDIFTKTICECRNKSQLKKAESIAKELGLEEGVDFGYINDSCKTDLEPENEDGTCTVGMWFKPLPDSIAHKISKKFQLYRDEQ